MYAENILEILCLDTQDERLQFNKFSYSFFSGGKVY